MIFNEKNLVYKEIYRKASKVTFKKNSQLVSYNSITTKKLNSSWVEKEYSLPNTIKLSFTNIYQSQWTKKG